LCQLLIVVSIQVKWPAKLQIAQGVIHGMNYLHTQTPPIIHGDLKVQNVLIGDGFKAKVNAVSFLIHIPSPVLMINVIMHNLTVVERK